MELTEAHRERMDAVYTYAREHLSRGAREREAAACLDRSLWHEAAAFGRAGLPIPEAGGGSGIDALLRDAVPSRIFSGSSELQRALSARTLGLP